MDKFSALWALRTPHISTSWRADVAASEYLEKLLVNLVRELKLSGRILYDYSAAAIDYSAGFAVLAFSSSVRVEAVGDVQARGGRKFEFEELRATLVKRCPADKVVVELWPREPSAQRRIVELWKLYVRMKSVLSYRKFLEAVVDEVTCPSQAASRDALASVSDLFNEVVETGKVRARDAAGSIVEASVNSLNRALCAVVARRARAASGGGTEGGREAAVVLLDTDKGMTRLSPIEVLEL